VTTTQEVRSLETEEEKERLGSWLAEKAPKDIGADKRGMGRSKRLVAKIIERYPAASFNDIYYCLDNWWVLRCKPGLPTGVLKKIVREEFDAAILDRRHKPKDFHERSRLENGAKTRRTEKRRDNAALLKHLADTLGCTTRYARMLIADGTTDRATAESLARMLGTQPEEHLRKKRRTGRQPDLVSWFMKIWVPTGSFRDFVEDDSFKLPLGTYELLETLREQKGALKSEQSEISSLENLIEYSRSIRRDFPVADAATKIWCFYRLWKIDVVAAQATRMANEGHWADVADSNGKAKAWR
jgi:hypothetical protein